MEIRSLEQSTLQELIDCFLEAFSSYAIKMPEDIEYWNWRFYTARVDFSLSYGCFHDDKLVAFIFIGVDEIAGVKIAFNTGTGVVEAHRGKKLVDKLYAHAIPNFKLAGIDCCSLEVLTSNERAIRVYERIGFVKTKTLHCYNQSNSIAINEILTKELDVKRALERSKEVQSHYSWDFINSALLRTLNTLTALEVFDERERAIGYFIINKKRKTLCQLELYSGNSNLHWTMILRAIEQSEIKSIKLNNVDKNRVELNKSLLEAKWDNHVDQYEMIMKI